MVVGLILSRHFSLDQSDGPANQQRAPFEPNHKIQTVLCVVYGLDVRGEMD